MAYYLKIIVTGGASFISSHLVDALLDQDHEVVVVDNFSSGKIENLADARMNHLPMLQIIEMDISQCSLSHLQDLFYAVNPDLVFHLASVHGGRGYIDSHPADVMESSIIDYRIFRLCAERKIPVVYASSACVYPPRLQEEVGHSLREEEAPLTEKLESDDAYGTGKAYGELMLDSLHRQYGLRYAAMRFVTAYGPRENESHAIIALIYKTLSHQDPFEIWGTGEQTRDFTYVADIVSGCVAAGNALIDGVFDAESINLGTNREYTINETCELIFDYINWHPSEIKRDTSLPTGVQHRLLNNNKAKQLLGWTPQYTLAEGLRLTIDHYRETHPNLAGKPVNQKKLWER